MQSIGPPSDAICIPQMIRETPAQYIDPAPPYEPPRYNFTGQGTSAHAYGGEAYPAGSDSFMFNRATYPEIPGLYNEYGNEHIKMMEINARHKAQQRNQIRRIERSEVVTVRTRSQGSKCGLIFFFVLSLIIVGGFIALVFYVVSSRT